MITLKQDDLYNQVKKKLYYLTKVDEPNRLVLKKIELCELILEVIELEAKQ